MNVYNIAQIADIHIRLYKRHIEYRQVFDRLYKSLKENETNLIILLGDIFHNKINLSPEAVDMCSNFIYSLSKIAPTHIVVGNHDCIVNLPSRLDSISPIVERMRLKNVYIHRKSGLFDVDDNLTFGVFAINDSQNYPITFDRNHNRIYMSLFHGAINKSQTEVGHIIKTSNSIELFRNYDFALLGDIHKMQVLRNRENGLIDSAYSGSLIQQDFGELQEKGYILWNVPIKSEHKATFIEVPNEYGFCTLELDSLKHEDIEKKLESMTIPKKPYIRVIIDSADYNQIVIKDVTSFIREKVHPLSITVEANIGSFDKTITLKDLALENISQLSTQKKMIREYLKGYKFPEEDIKKILIIHEEFFNSYLQEELVNKGNVWNIRRIEFDNTFSYGVNNSVDFDTIKGLVGIFSANGTGKSALLDSLLMGFFSMCSRASRKNLVDVINKSEDYANIVIDFAIDDREYRIKRVIERRKDDNSRALNTVTLFELIDGEEVDLSGEARIRETEEIIRSIVGNFDEHTITTFGLQDNLTNFINMNQGARKEIISKIMGLNILENLFSVISEECKSLKTIVTQYKKHDYRAIHVGYDKKKNEINRELDKLNDRRNQCVKEDASTKKRISELRAIIKEVESGDVDLETLESNLASAKKSLRQQKIKEVEAAADKRNKAHELAEVDKQMSAITNIDEITVAVAEYEAAKKKKVKLEQELRELERDHVRHAKLASILTQHDWFTSTEQCKKCTFLSTAFESKDSVKTIESKMFIMTGDLSFTNAEIAALEPSVEIYESYNKLLERKSYIEKELQIYSLSLEKVQFIITTTQNTIESISAAIESYKKNEEIISLNNRAEEEIAALEKVVKASEQEIKAIEKEISAKNVELGQITQKLKDLTDSMQSLKEVEESFRYHSILKDALSKDGIQLAIINKMIPRINLEIKKILSNIPDFEIKIDIDKDSQDIFVYIEDANNIRNIELGSGMEKVIAAVAVRAALAQISLLPKCNIFVIDEGFGSLDTDNLNNMNLLLGYLKSKFDTVLIISHVDMMQDVCDHIVTIDKGEGYSKLKIS